MATQTEIEMIAALLHVHADDLDLEELPPDMVDKVAAVLVEWAAGGVPGASARTAAQAALASVDAPWSLEPLRWLFQSGVDGLALIARAINRNWSQEDDWDRLSADERQGLCNIVCDVASDVAYDTARLIREKKRISQEIRGLMPRRNALSARGVADPVAAVWVTLFDRFTDSATNDPWRACQLRAALQTLDDTWPDLQGR